MFGEVAEMYDRYRPAYPSALVADLLALAPAHGSERALEVGAGTGKATVQFARGGAAVLALEPSPEMARIARRACAPYARVEVVESDFERWAPGGERFALIYAAQAWHWVDPATGFGHARQALAGDGLLAAFWNRPAWGDTPIRAALARAYADTVPDLVPDGPLHPANLRVDDGHRWPGAVAAAGGFGQTEVRSYPWVATYSADAYAGMVGTLSETRLLADEARARLLGAVRAVIDAHGGSFELPMTTLVCLARAAG